jgi:hypothetical protein
MSNPKHGGSRPALRPDDKRLVKKENKHRHRMITLPPDLDDRLIRWSIETSTEVSPTIAKMVDIFLTEKGY